MPRSRTSRTVLAASAALLVAGLVAATSPAGAETAPSAKPVTLATKLVSPLSLAVAPNGTIYVTENFAGALVRKPPHGEAAVIHPGRKGSDVGGASVAGKSVIVTVTPPQGPAVVKRVTKSGKISTIANTGKYEATNNPDGATTYGFSGISEECAAGFPDDVPATYLGLVDSHPYATDTVGGTTYVADAGANAIFALEHGSRARSRSCRRRRWRSPPRRRRPTGSPTAWSA